jgi:hypothetical protein
MFDTTVLISLSIFLQSQLVNLVFLHLLTSLFALSCLDTHSETSQNTHIIQSVPSLNLLMGLSFWSQVRVCQSLVLLPYRRHLLGRGIFFFFMDLLVVRADVLFLQLI